MFHPGRPFTPQCPPSFPAIAQISLARISQLHKSSSSPPSKQTKDQHHARHPTHHRVQTRRSNTTRGAAIQCHTRDAANIDFAVHEWTGGTKSAE